MFDKLDHNWFQVSTLDWSFLQHAEATSLSSESLKTFNFASYAGHTVSKHAAWTKRPQLLIGATKLHLMTEYQRQRVKIIGGETKEESRGVSGDNERRYNGPM